MTTYIALLRGINVGGKNIIKMAELKRTIEALGLKEVQTYIQSGNVLFKSDEEEEQLRKRIEQEIETVFGFAAAVVLRSAAELYDILRNCPFSRSEISAAEASAEGESLYVALLPQAPAQEGIERISVYKSESDDYRIIGREVFLLFNNSIRNSKLAGNLHKLGVPSTVRNWKTMSKLGELAKAMEG